MHANRIYMRFDMRDKVFFFKLVSLKDLLDNNMFHVFKTRGLTSTVNKQKDSGECDAKVLTIALWLGQIARCNLIVVCFCFQFG